MIINKKVDDNIRDMNDGRKNKSPNRNKIGIVIICIGKKGVGKSTTIRDVLTGIKKINPDKDFYICDPNSEFTDFYFYDVHAPFNDFMCEIEDVTKSVIFVEEATIFLDPRKREGILVNKMVKARHEENIIIMNFHSWRSVPTYIFDMIDYMYIHKTNDTEQKVRLKCDIPFVMEAFREVNEHENKYFKILIDLNK